VKDNPRKENVRLTAESLNAVSLAVDDERDSTTLRPASAETQRVVAAALLRDLKEVVTK